MREKHLLLAGTLLLLMGCSAQNPRTVTTLNDKAQLAGDLPSNPLEWQIITSAVNQQDATMYTLFGNGLAVRSARTNALHDYPAGSVLSLVTWTQQEDPRWFGGNIPAAPKSVEYVSVTADKARRPWYSYTEFAGAPLKKVLAEDGPVPKDRAAYLLSQRAAPMP